MFLLKYHHMQGLCIFCGHNTSTKKTQRCKKCYQKETQNKFKQKNEIRNKEILHDITKKHITAAQCGRKYKLSREAIRLILKKSGVDYQQIKTLIREEKLTKARKEELIRKTKLCSWNECRKSFVVNCDGAKVKYCSDKCYVSRHKKLQRERVRKYYQNKKLQAF